MYERASFPPLSFSMAQYGAKLNPKNKVALSVPGGLASSLPAVSADNV